MAKTAAQRQAAYRAKRPFAGAEGNGERQLNTWVDTGAFLALARLAHRYGVTKRQMIEQMLITADARILATLEPNTAEWDEYFQTKK